MLLSLGIGFISVFIALSRLGDCYHLVSHIVVFKEAFHIGVCDLFLAALTVIMVEKLCSHIRCLLSQLYRLLGNALVLIKLSLRIPCTVYRLLNFLQLILCKLQVKLLKLCLYSSILLSGLHSIVRQILSIILALYLLAEKVLGHALGIVKHHIPVGHLAVDIVDIDTCIYFLAACSHCVGRISAACERSSTHSRCKHGSSKSLCLRH